VVDNVNCSKGFFEEYCELAESLNQHIVVEEKIFYEPLDVLLERDAKRTTKVGPTVVKSWWSKLGKDKLKDRVPKTKTFYKNIKKTVTPLVQDESLPHVVICDLDMTIADNSWRSPYDASNCDKDPPITSVINMVKLLRDNGKKIIFFSGREDKYEAQTRIFLDTHVGGEYELFMRKTANQEADNIIKNRIYDEYIKDKYYVYAWIDDRLQVCKMVHELGLPLYRVGDPLSKF